MILFNLNYLLKILSPNVVALGASILIYEFRGDTVQFIASKHFHLYKEHLIGKKHEIVIIEKFK